MSASKRKSRPTRIGWASKSEAVTFGLQPFFVRYNWCLAHNLAEEAELKYYVVPRTDALVAAPSMIEYKVREAFQLAGLKNPPVNKWVGDAAIAIWSYDPDTEEAIRLAFEKVVGNKGRVTECYDAMRQWIHGKYTD